MPGPAELLRAMPKVELHVHLEGTLGRDRIVELAAAAAEPLPRAPDELFAFGDLDEFLRARVVDGRSSRARPHRDRRVVLRSGARRGAPSRSRRLRRARSGRVGRRAGDDVTDAHEHLSWEEFGAGARELAASIVADGFGPTVLLAIARGGLPVGGAVSYALGVKNCCVINVEYYTGIDQRLDVPVILPPALHLVDLSGERLLVIDDVADTGETLRLVADTIRPHVADLRTAVLYEKSRSVVRCDYVWRRTDRWIDFPWSTLPPLEG